jgi:hypothetical protein
VQGLGNQVVFFLILIFFWTFHVILSYSLKDTVAITVRPCA